MQTNVYMCVYVYSQIGRNTNIGNNTDLRLRGSEKHLLRVVKIIGGLDRRGIERERTITGTSEPMKSQRCGAPQQGV